MPASISVMAVEAVKFDRPSSVGELTVTTGTSRGFGSVEFVIQVTKDQAVTFGVDEQSVRVLIAALDQAASAVEERNNSARRAADAR